MSITDKIGSLMQRPNEDLVAKDDVPVWLKYTARIVGAVGGAIALFFGIVGLVFNILSGFGCIVAALWQAVAAFTVLVIEAPCCCLFVDYVQDASNFIDRRPYWNRAVYYILIGIVPIFMCFSMSTFLGGGIIVADGVLYGMMALGKKASTEEMRSNAATVYSPNQQYPPAAPTGAPFSNPFDSKV